MSPNLFGLFLFSFVSLRVHSSAIEHQYCLFPFGTQMLTKEKSDMTKHTNLKNYVHEVLGEASLTKDTK